LGDCSFIRVAGAQAKFSCIAIKLDYRASGAAAVLNAAEMARDALSLARGNAVNRTGEIGCFSAYAQIHRGRVVKIIDATGFVGDVHFLTPALIA
jgi:hypothetical protein